MSEFALLGIAVGIGLLFSAVVMFAYRDELAVALRQRFGGEADEPDPAAILTRSPSEQRSQRLKRQGVVAFGVLAGIALLGVGIVYGQVLAIAAGAIGLGQSIYLGWSSRKEGLL